MENESVKKAVRLIHLISDEYKIVHTFAMDTFYKSEQYKNNPIGSIWFNGYDIIDEENIRIKYQYGGGDMEMGGHFDIKI